MLVAVMFLALQIAGCATVRFGQDDTKAPNSVASSSTDWVWLAITGGLVAGAAGLTTHEQQRTFAEQFFSAGK